MDEKENLMTEKSKKMSKKKKIIIVCAAIVLFIALLAGGAYTYQEYLKTHNSSKEQNNNSNDNNNSKDDNNQQDNGSNGSGDQTPTPSGKVLYIYRDNDSVYAADSTKGNSNADYTKVGEYQCESDKCESKDGTVNYILVNDDDTYYLYNYVTKEKRTLNLGTETYNGLLLLAYDGKVYGVTASKDKHDAIYSLAANKYITDFIYDDVSYGDAGLSKGYVFVTIDNGSNGAIAYVLKLSNGEIVKSTQADNDYNCVQWRTVIAGNKTFYLTDTGIDFPSVVFYDSNFNQLLDGKTFSIYDITDDDHIVVVNDNDKTFSDYSSTGTLLYTSKEYTQVGILDKGYAGVITTDGYLKLVDYRDNIVANFVKWSDNLHFHNMISGYFDIDGKPRGIYLTVENNSTQDMTPGHCQEYYYDIDHKTTGVENEDTCSGYAKPVLYLYPTKETNVTVSFAKPYLLTTTYPKYNNDWKVTAEPNGDLYDQSGRYYYALYWEEQGSSNVDFHEGFYVTSNNAAKFLENELAKIGLTDREANEFIMYWLPVLEKNGKSLVYFELTGERQAYNELKISPKPDSLLRLAIHIKKVDSYVKIKEEKLPTFQRNGFTAVEWGGVIH